MTPNLKPSRNQDRSKTGAPLNILLKTSNGDEVTLGELVKNSKAVLIVNVKSGCYWTLQKYPDL